MQSENLDNIFNGASRVRVSGEDNVPLNHGLQSTGSGKTDPVFTPEGLASELRLTAGSLHYAEAISPGVASRVSAADATALIQGALRCLLPIIRQNPAYKALAPPDIRVGPAASYLLGLQGLIGHFRQPVIEQGKPQQSTSKKTLYSDAVKKRSGSAGNKSGALGSRSLTNVRPTVIQGKGAKPSVKADRPKPQVPKPNITKPALKPKDPAVKERDRLLSKSLRALESKDWKDLIDSLNITKDYVISAIKVIPSTVLLNQDKSVPPLIRAGIVSISQLENWANVSMADEKSKKALQTFIVAANRLRDVFPANGKPSLIKCDGWDSELLLKNRTKLRNDVIQTVSHTVRQSISLSDEDKVYVNLATKAPRDTKGLYPIVIDYKVQKAAGSGDEAPSYEFSKSRTWMVATQGPNRSTDPIVLALIPSREAAVAFIKNKPSDSQILDLDHASKKVDEKKGDDIPMTFADLQRLVEQEKAAAKLMDVTLEQASPVSVSMTSTQTANASSQVAQTGVGTHGGVPQDLKSPVTPRQRPKPQRTPSTGKDSKQNPKHQRKN